jgi:6-phosphogluconolactonase
MSMTRSLCFVVISIFLCGCGKTNDTPANSVQQPSALIGYVSNGQSNSVTSFSIDETSGSLIRIATAGTGDAPSRLATSLNRRFLFVANALDGTVGSYAIDGKGSMQPLLQTHLVDPLGKPYGMLVSPSGSFLFVGSAANAVEVFQIDSATGALRPVQGSPFQVRSKATQMALTHSGKFLYAFGDGSDAIYCFAVDSATGTLTQIAQSPVLTGLDPLAAQSDLTDKYLVVTTDIGQRILVYAISSDGSLIETPTSRISVGSQGALSLAFSPDNSFLFVDVLFSNSISIFKFDANTGSLSPIPGSPFLDGNVPSSIAPTPKGTILVVARSNPGSIASYRIDIQSGAISEVQSSAIETGKSPFGVIVVPNAP